LIRWLGGKVERLLRVRRADLCWLASCPGEPDQEPGRQAKEAVELRPRQAAPRLIEAEGSPMFEYSDDRLMLSQIRTAEFARMSTSKQLSLWAILRAQMSSKKQLAAQAPLAAQKTVPASPREWPRG
jgi:hypothetical protein